ncbi:TRAP transporter small permease [Thalassospira alkalitolerans]|uniref:TRAP transporter small permease n=1 Tax=Thalassospira alkalitolerans TaxID=1293890 RepID=UPI003AA8A391
MADRDGIPIDFSAEPSGEDGPGKVFDAGAPGKSIKVEEALAALALALICLISLANVVVRYMTDVSFAFTEEFSVFLLVVMTLLGASIAFARNEHIRITFFLERFPRPVRVLAEMITLAITTLLFSMVVYYGFLFTLDEYKYDEISAGLGYPSWIYSIWLPMLAVLILVRVLGRGWLLARAGKSSAKDGERS